MGVDYLHRMEIASRDIKLENTLLDTSPRPLVKICDFGYSKVRHHSRDETWLQGHARKQMTDAACPCGDCRTAALRQQPPQLLLGTATACRASDICCACSLQHEKFHSAPGSRVGTPAYLAPEVIMTTKGQTYDGKVSIAPARPFQYPLWPDDCTIPVCQCTDSKLTCMLLLERTLAYSQNSTAGAYSALTVSFFGADLRHLVMRRDAVCDAGGRLPL